MAFDNKFDQIDEADCMHRYVWTGPYDAPLFINIDFFFHVNNILQLSMFVLLSMDIRTGLHKNSFIHKPQSNLSVN